MTGSIPAAGCVAVLFHEAPTLESVADALLRTPDVTAVDVESGGVRVETREGVFTASAYSAQWPDDDPESLAELGAGGALGLATGALQRAGDQNAVWPAGELAARVHRGFVHITATEHVAGPVDVTTRLEKLGTSLLADPKALCLFFPLGEALRDGNILGQIRATSEEQGALPLQSWVNGRLADAGMGTHVADLVGLAQIGMRDCEAVFPARESLAPYEVLGFLLDVTHHLVSEGGAIEDGVVYDGPGGLRWRAGLDQRSQIPPERDIVRWIPLAPDES